MSHIDNYIARNKESMERLVNGYVFAPANDNFSQRHCDRLNRSENVFLRKIEVLNGLANAAAQDGWAPQDIAQQINLAAQFANAGVGIATSLAIQPPPLGIALATVQAVSFLSGLMNQQNPGPNPIQQALAIIGQQLAEMQQQLEKMDKKLDLVLAGQRVIYQEIKSLSDDVKQGFQRLESQIQQGFAQVNAGIQDLVQRIAQAEVNAQQRHAQILAGKDILELEIGLVVQFQSQWAQAPVQTAQGVIHWLGENKLANANNANHFWNRVWNHFKTFAGEVQVILGTTHEIHPFFQLRFLYNGPQQQGWAEGNALIQKRYKPIYDFLVARTHIWGNQELFSILSPAHTMSALQTRIVPPLNHQGNATTCTYPLINLQNSLSPENVISGSKLLIFGHYLCELYRYFDLFDANGNCAMAFFDAQDNVDEQALFQAAVSNGKVYLDRLRSRVMAAIVQRQLMSGDLLLPELYQAYRQSPCNLLVFKIFEANPIWAHNFLVYAIRKSMLQRGTAFEWYEVAYNQHNDYVRLLEVMDLYWDRLEYHEGRWRVQFCGYAPDVAHNTAWYPLPSPTEIKEGVFEIEPEIKDFYILLMRISSELAKYA